VHSSPQRLDVISPDIAPVDERLRVGHLVGLFVALHHEQLGAINLGGRLADRVGGGHEQQVADRRLIAQLADELAHDAEPARAHHRAVVSLEVTGDDADQRGLARPIRPDERCLAALADAQVDIAQQWPPVRQAVLHARDVDMSHNRESFPTGRARLNRVSWPHHRFVGKFAAARATAIFPTN
jgi:hypothetical protein